jgi:hypothetical protein
VDPIEFAPKRRSDDQLYTRFWLGTAESPSNALVPMFGAWRASRGVGDPTSSGKGLCIDNNNGNALVQVGSREWMDARLTVIAWRPSGPFGVAFRITDKDNYWLASYDPTSGVLSIDRYTDGTALTIATGVHPPEPVGPRKPNASGPNPMTNLYVEVEGPSIRAYLLGEPRPLVEMTAPDAVGVGHVGIWTSEATMCFVEDFVIERPVAHADA